MKSLLDKSQPIGGDGATISEKITVDETYVKVAVELAYPTAKILAPATDVLDGLGAKIKAAIPGDIENGFVDSLIEGAKKQLIALITA